MQIPWDVPGGVAHVVYPLFGGDRVQHDDGTWTPTEFTYVEMPSDQRLPYYVVECGYGHDLVPRIMAVQVIQRDPNREVRSSDLRRLHLEDALEEAWLQVTRRPVAVTDDTSRKPADLLQAQPRRAEKIKTLRGLRVHNRRRITADVHTEVAQVYRENAFSGAPTRAVAEHFGLATSTAFLYVKRARDAGALEPRPPAKGDAGGASRPSVTTRTKPSKSPRRTSG